MIDQKILESVASAVAEAWGTLFVKAVSLEVGEAKALEDQGGDWSGSFVRADLRLGGDLSGSSTILVSKEQALTMVGMMMSMGGDDALIDSTREGECGDEEIDGLKETFNQFAATSATVLRGEIGGDVQVQLGKVTLVEIDSLPDDLGEDAVGVTYTLSLEGYDDGELIQIFDTSAQASLGGSTASTGTSKSVGSAGSKPEVDLNKLHGLTVNAELILAERSMDLESFLTLGVGSVIEFWKPCDHPAELMVQDSVMAAGEVVLTSQQHFGLRVFEVAPPKRVYQKGAS
jgi:flagellar motor switch/type III secretory pathway protein FliN